MSEVIESLASQVGITPELAINDVGAVLAYLREHPGDEVLTKLLAVLPDPHKLIESFQSGQGEAGSGGLVSMVTGLASKLLGGQIGDVTKFVSPSTGLGFSVKQLEAFLPKVIAMLHKFLPTEMLGRLSALGLGLNEEKSTVK